jgi:hypothetical protein
VGLPSGTRSTSVSRRPPRWADGASAVRTLALVEARRLLTHPVVALGTAIGVASLVTQAPTAEADFLSYKYAVGVLLWPAVISVLVAANLAASRSRRSDSDELFASMPLQSHDRAAAHVASLTPALLVAAAAQAAVWIALRPWNGLSPPLLPGRDGIVQPVTPPAAAWLQGPVLVAVGGVLGVAIARWIPTAAAVTPVAAGLFLSSISLLWWNWGWPRFLLPFAHDLRLGSPVDVGGGSSVVVRGSQPAALTWHVVYLVGLLALLGGLALLRDAPRRRGVILASTGFVAATLGGCMQALEWRV